MSNKENRNNARIKTLFIYPLFFGFPSKPSSKINAQYENNIPFFSMQGISSSHVDYHKKETDLLFHFRVGLSVLIFERCQKIHTNLSFVGIVNYLARKTMQYKIPFPSCSRVL